MCLIPASEALVEALPNSAFSASSEWRSQCQARRAKLSRSGWCAENDAVGEWLQIDLGGEYVIDTVSTTASNRGEWVSSYRLSRSLDSSQFVVVSIFDGNSDSDTEVEHALPDPITARYLRFEPLEWSTWPSMKVEAYGFLAGDTVTPSPTTSSSVHQRYSTIIMGAGMAGMPYAPSQRTDDSFKPSLCFRSIGGKISDGSVGVCIVITMQT